MRVVVVAGLCLALANVAVATPAHAATRDIRIHLTNRSDVELQIKSYNLPDGCWSVKPPDKIAVDQTIDIASESCGVATGTEFTVQYWVGTTGLDFTLRYNNPFAGSDEFNEDAAEGFDFESSGTIENRTVSFKCEGPCDGIPRAWKTNGVTIDPGDGQPPQFVDLPRMGVSLDRPTVLIHMDWMQDATNNQALQQAALDAVIRAFDQDPVVHRGATRPGITLIIDAGPDSTLTPGGAKWGSLSRAKAVPWMQGFLAPDGADGYIMDNFYTLMKANFVPTGRLPIFHYGVAVAELATGDSTSGLTTGDKLGFMTSLYGWTGNVGSLAEQTGTFMHEFGHVLDLDHSGGQGDGDEVNRAPNYPSVMSYAYQTRGVFRNGAVVFDFSRDTMPDVDETMLTEAGGVNLGANPSNYGTTYSCWTKDAAGADVRQTFTQAGRSPVDWNCDGTTPNGGTGFDANSDRARTTLRGSTSDWSRIKFRTGGVGRGSNARSLVKFPEAGARSNSHRDISAKEARYVRSLPLESNLSYTGATTADYHDTALVSATLTDPGAPTPAVVGKAVTFVLGSDVCTGVTDSSGAASCTLNVTQVPGAHTLKASFAGDSMHRAVSVGTAFTVTREETTLTFTGPTVILAGSSTMTLSATITEDGENEKGPGGVIAPPSPSGQPIVFTLGQQSCTGLADANGVATCSIQGIASDLGGATISASFAGDTYYEPSSDSDAVIVFAFPRRGAFVIGDRSAAMAGSGAPVTWWSSSWSTANSTSGGASPSAFKGFAADVKSLPSETPANVCGQHFTTKGGNSPPPTEDVPEYMGVIVASSVSKAGSTINGTWGGIVVVKTDGTYAPNPGHAGRGTIVATFC